MLANRCVPSVCGWRWPQGLSKCVSPTHEFPSAEIFNCTDRESEGQDTVALCGSFYIHHLQQSWSHGEKTAGHILNKPKQLIIKAAWKGQSGIRIHTVQYYMEHGKFLVVSKKFPASVQGTPTKKHTTLQLRYAYTFSALICSFKLQFLNTF